MKSYQFCNNCGKNGHLYHCCKKPITSSGIIAFKNVKEERAKYKYLLICRKDSLGYVDFIRGKYPLYNIRYIQNIINEMTIDEKSKLMRLTFKELWTDLWGDYGLSQYNQEEKTSYNKFKTIKEGIKYDTNNNYNLKILIESSTTNWLTPEWGFPKGRRNYLENDLMCGIREFKEETGLSESKINIIKNVIPYDEIFMGSNYKSYKHKYYLAYIKNIDEINMNTFQKTEVSKMKWCDMNEILSLIRPYNLEKKDIIIKIDKILHKYSLIS
jgi:8-oxo-dGTP pyrophosphatase MutT (NUDIX family)